MDSEEEFDKPQFKQKQVKFEIRKEQLLPTQPNFLSAPRPLSASSFFNLEKKDAFPVKLPKRSKSQMILTIDLPELPKNTKTQEEITNEVIEKMYQLRADTPPYIETVTKTLLQNRSVILNDELDKHIFVALSSILQVNKEKRALFIVPSSNILTWIRSFLPETSAKWPEGRVEQQNALSKLRSGSTQVLLCINTNTNNLILDHIDYIFVVKAELSTRCFPHIQGFKGPILFHQTPGYNTDFPFSCEKISGNFEFQTVPNIVKVADYVGAIPKLLQTLKGLKTIIICPTKKICGEVIARAGSSVSHFTNQEPSEGSTYVSTTAFLFTTAKFDSYIFAGFPPSLDLLMSSCLIGKQVSILLNIPTAQQMQRYSHDSAVDRTVVFEVVKKVVWGGSCYRKTGEIVTFNNQEIDATPEGLSVLYTSMAKHGICDYIPFDAESVTIKVKTMIEEMNSPLFKIITQSKSDRRGLYTFKMSQLAHDANLSPMKIANDFKRIESLGAIDVTYSGKVTMLSLHQHFGDKSYQEILNTVTNEMQKHEDDFHDSFNIIYTITQLPDIARKYYESEYKKESLGEIMEIPYDRVDEDKIKKLVKSRSIQWTPRVAARILQGISSPLYPFDMWKSSGHWSALQNCKFSDIMKATQDLLTRQITRPDEEKNSKKK
ncbi:hypothetical protein TVAG_283660 [Trichomonas vaginalis G3]|uniref:Uncharacterized protein n=1 Tax=Trichomonas vaginalis (strain ATCC PRA-98 / G3) TaxID=412133 RepID=A2DES0_TRIV3|nr:ATP-dependent DNA helicase family [Trichomonas vaginalis G3]EAY21197.1 hypothetical protein TVAG_283660 [Trichomonas vaginalis G3]KAI5522273.1 ATP-dependent DNA helicase family [Trichomonas vaginalis G3]|eukprot:XP_001582183.1 hypothetical protein [Trichomonas vaginalis G3]